MKPKYLILIIIVPVIVAAGAYLTIRLIKNAENRLIEETKEKLSIEKEVFVDEFLDELATFNIFWEKGELEISLVRPDGTIIRKEDAETNPDIQWNVGNYTLGDTYIIIHIFEPESGIWKVIGVPINGVVPEFIVKLTGKGAVNEILVLESNSKSYIHPVKPLIGGMLTGPHLVKGAEIFGKVLHPDGRKTDFKLYDDGLKEHGDYYPNDGVYSNYFTDFSTSGFYRFEMTGKNVDGTTVVSEDMFLPISEPVPPFTREADLTIEIK